jgi:2-haloalkanoic acid dehalogenase type II
VTPSLQREPTPTAGARIRLITIDLDDTLWPCAPVIDKAEATVHAWLSVHARRLTAVHDIASLRAHRRDLMRAQPELAHDITAVRRNSLEALLAAHGYDPALAAEAVAVFLAARQEVTPFTDVLPALAELARDYYLVSVTNGNADVHRTPVGIHIRQAFTAAEVGAAKPAPDVFHAALRVAGVGPADALHLGDDPALDIAAARALGMRTVWMNRYGMQWPAELPAPDGMVTNLHEFRQWLAAAGAPRRATEST